MSPGCAGCCRLRPASGAPYDSVGLWEHYKGLLLICAGTVCVLGSSDSAGEAAVQRVVERYGQSTGGYNATVRPKAPVSLPCYASASSSLQAKDIALNLKAACKERNSQPGLVQP